MARRAVDLFCGCGGLTLGLAHGGFDVEAGVDSWLPALQVYRANFRGHAGIRFDLSDEGGTVDLVSSFAPYLIAGGPPCQDFSIAGKLKEGDRADLTVKYARVVAKVRPPTFIMENVPRASLSDAYKEARSIFKEAGYGLTVRVLDAVDFGVPQYRKRLIMVGMLGQRDGFLDLQFDLRLAMGPPRITVREFLLDEIDGVEDYYRHPRTYARRAIYSVDEPSATIRGVNRPRPSSYKKHPDDSAEPSEVQALNTYQRARIQTFPKGFIWPEEILKSTVEQMVGNAVPVKLAAFVARALHDHIEAVESSSASVDLAARARRLEPVGADPEWLPIAAE